MSDIMLTTPPEIEAASVLALRSALQLQVVGLKYGRGRSALTIARSRNLTTARTAVKALEDVNKYIADNYGM